MSDSKLSPDKSLLSTAIAAYERQFKATGSINVTGESAAWLLGELRRSSLSATEQTFSSDPAEVREFNQGFEAFGKGVRYTDLPDLPTDTNGIGWAWAWFLKNRPDRTAPSHAAEPIPNISERMERLIHMAATMTTNNEAYKTTQLAQELLEGRRSLLAGALEGGSPIRSPATQTQGAPALAAGDAARPSTERPVHPDNIECMISSLVSVVHYDMREAAEKDLRALVDMAKRSNGREPEGVKLPYPIGYAANPIREPGRIPDLEGARRNADYWEDAARNEPERSDALQHLHQAVNAWKNAAYAMADQRDSALSSTGTLDDVTVEFDPDNNFCFKRGSKWVPLEDALKLVAAPSASARSGPYPLPENWRITIDCEKKQAIVTHPNIGGYAASDDSNNIAGTMLYWLAVALARAPIDASRRPERPREAQRLAQPAFRAGDQESMNLQQAKRRYAKLGGSPSCWNYIKAGCDCRNCEINRQVRRERKAASLRVDRTAKP